MVKEPLTETEARVLWNCLRNTWAPLVGYDEFISAMEKLCALGGGFICRDCTALGTHPSKLGGFLCDEHKEIEAKRYQTQEATK